MFREPNLERKLAAEHRALLERYKPHSAIEMLDRIDKRKAYHFVSEELAAIWAAIAREFGVRALGEFQKLTMLQLMDEFEVRAAKHRYVDGILECFQRSFFRILRNIENKDCEDYDTVNDILLKDLALCRHRLFPAGAQVIEPGSGFSRTLMFRGGLRQFWSVIRVLQETGGNSGYYMYHTHLRELDGFNPDGFVRFYIRVADMLGIHPEVRGLFTATWFLDPALREVSPHLAHIRNLPESNGASFFFSGISTNTGALSKSATRQRLYAEGKYVPKVYYMVWPRDKMISWAENVRSTSREIRRFHLDASGNG